MNSIPSNYYPLIGAAVFVVLLYLAKKRKGLKVSNPLSSFGAKSGRDKVIEGFLEIHAESLRNGVGSLADDVLKAGGEEAKANIAKILIGATKPVPNGSGPAAGSGA